MSESRRIASGQALEGEEALHFSFDGRRYTGRRGDTLASALLANGVHLVGRSFKYHRPRGIVTAGSEEPNALIQLEQGPHTEPNTRATQIELYDGLVAHSQNRWPSLKFDIGAVNSLVSRALPAGFYYKTFMWPASMWLTYEKFIRKAAGLGHSPTEADPDWYEQVHAHCDVLVVGAGPAGLSAARALSERGADVMLIDEQSQVGGSLSAQQVTIDGKAGPDWAAEQLQGCADSAGFRYLPRTSVAGYYDYNYLTALERVTDHKGPGGAKGSSSKLPRQRFWKIRAQRVLLATGSIERPLIFADNDRPGVMLASAVRAYLNRYGVACGEKMVVFTNNDSAYLTALESAAAGCEVSLVDVRKNPLGALVNAASAAGITLHTNSAITAVNGKLGVRSVVVQHLNDSGDAVHGSHVTIECDVVANAGGWNPTVHLFSQARGKLRFDEQLQAFLPDAAVAINPCVSAGACNGEHTTQRCIEDGLSAARATAQALSLAGDISIDVPAIVESQHAADTAEPVTSGLRALWAIPTDHPIGRGPRKHFHDFQNDVTVADIQLASREGYQSVEHLKRYTTTGMGTDQGKTSNVNALAIMAELRDRRIPEVGTTTFRPPFTPVTFGAIAGLQRDGLFLPQRQTPMHQWHQSHGAVFEDVGDWKRPWYYPQAGEDMHQAVQRECLAVRQHAGLVDASTLGKIDIQGENAAEFLNMVYTNAWLKLGIGRCRYGLMLNEHGMVFDDGVTTRLGEHHFHMTTTTGGAARVMGWLEEWLQTEWPEKKVYCTSVTEQWAVASLSGPKAASILSRLTDLDLGVDSFPHMSMQEADVAGVPARVFRISFTGEAGYEINVPARYGQHLWESLVAAGESDELCVYGTESMHVLRAEKGFIIAGQDTDGTVTPYDLGMDWIVNTKKPDFLGKRSLARTDTARAGRPQLVGLLTDDPEFVLPEGAHIVSELREAPPMPTAGHVTSSYYSPNAERSIAMALVNDGLSRIGQKVDIRLMDGEVIHATLTNPVFVDPEGKKLHV